MVPQTISLVAIISLYLVLVQRIAGQSASASAGVSTTLSDCTSDQIQNNKLGACVCHGGNSACGTTKCPVSPPGLQGHHCPTGLESQVFLQDCDSSCAGEKSHGCVGCWIWFQAVCSCLKNGGCPKSNSNRPFWLKVNSQLASTSLRIPNILRLQTYQALATSAWQFGQKTGVSDPNTQALAINSAHSITQKQIHMHICKVNTDMQKSLTKLYKSHGQSSPSFYNTLREVKDVPSSGERMFCRAWQTKLQPIPGTQISDDINSVLNRQDICEYYVGAAVIRDSNDYSWVCVTADHLSTEHQRFCA